MMERPQSGTHTNPNKQCTRGPAEQTQNMHRPLLVDLFVDLFVDVFDRILGDYGQTSAGTKEDEGYFYQELQGNRATTVSRPTN